MPTPHTHAADGSCDCHYAASPGPWRVEPTAPHKGIPIVDATGRIVGSAWTGNRSPVCDKNARIIAAAPEMLEAHKASIPACDEVAMGLNSIIDNCRHWTPEQIIQHCFDLQHMIWARDKVIRTLIARIENGG